jgi:hypothetical protein
MSTVWVGGQGEVLVRADAIVVLARARGGLDTECVTSRTARLADSERPGALRLALLDEIQGRGQTSGLPWSSCRLPRATRQPGVASTRTPCWIG